MTTTENAVNLWPEFSVTEVIKSPKSTLLEQAKFLAKGTKNLLTANVTTKAYKSEGFSHYFEIVAPNLDGYKYQLLYIRQENIFFYPCDLIYKSSIIKIKDEHQLLAELSDIFKDKETDRIIKSLISQSRDENEPIF